MKEKESKTYGVFMLSAENVSAYLELHLLLNRGRSLAEVTATVEIVVDAVARHGIRLAGRSTGAKRTDSSGGGEELELMYTRGGHEWMVIRLSGKIVCTLHMYYVQKIALRRGEVGCKYFGLEKSNRRGAISCVHCPPVPKFYSKKEVSATR